jgi:hypothetical protein
MILAALKETKSIVSETDMRGLYARIMGEGTDVGFSNFKKAVWALSYGDTAPCRLVKERNGIEPTGKITLSMRPGTVI